LYSISQVTQVFKGTLKSLEEAPYKALV